MARHRSLLYSLLMRVLIAAGLFPPESGGPATYAQLLADELPQRGFEVDVLPFARVRRLPPIVRHIAYFLSCLSRASRADLIYAQDTVSVGLSASLVALVLRKRFFVRVPGDHAWEQGRQRFGVVDDLERFQEKRYDWRVEAIRAIGRFVARRADAVIVPSEYMKHIVRRWGVSESRIQRIYSSVSLPALYESPSERTAGFLLVTAARLVPWKGIDELIHLVSDMPDWTLVIVGDGPDRARLERIASAEKGASRIRFVGQLSRVQTMGWIKSADVFVLNSTYEGLSYLLVEAMALGTPVVATSVGGNPELVDEKTGLLVASHDREALVRAIESVQKDPAAAQNRARAAHARVASGFSSESAIRSLADLLNRV